MLINNNTKVIVFNGTKVSLNYSKMPKRLINIIADKLDLYQYGEVCQYTGEILFKVGIKSNEGGIVGLFKTYSKSKMNKYIVNYVKN